MRFAGIEVRNALLYSLIGFVAWGGLGLLPVRAAVVLHPTDQASWQAWESVAPGGGYVGGSPVFANNGGAQIFSQSGFSGTMYVSFLVTGTTGHVLISKYTGSNSNIVYSVPTTTVVHYSNSFSSGDYLQYGAGASNWVSDTDAKTTFFCVSSTSWAECDALIPSAATSTASTTDVLSYDSGRISFGLAILIYMAGILFWGFVWRQVFDDEA